MLKDTKKNFLNAYDLIANLKGLSINTGEKNRANSGRPKNL